MIVKSCLKCEGRGTRRNYINRAGDFTVSHCGACEGTGKARFPETTAHAALKRIALGGITIVEAMRIADRALLENTFEENRA